MSFDKPTGEAPVQVAKHRTESKPRPIRKGWRTRLLMTFAVIILVTAGVLVAMDYMNFKNDEHSVLFKQKTSYSQNETVHIGKLALTILSSKHEPGEKAAYIPCTQNRGYQSMFNPYDTSCLNGQEYVAPAFDGDAIFKLSFKIRNESENILNLSDYKFTVVANTSIDSSVVKLKTNNILANSEFTTDYWGHLDNNYNGTYSLMIKHHSVQKSVAIAKF